MGAKREVKQEIVVDTKQIEDILVVLAEEISRRTEIHQMCEDDFRHNVTLSHENYILLRMTKSFYGRRRRQKRKRVFSRKWDWIRKNTSYTGVW